MHAIKNVRSHAVVVDNVSIDAGEQLSIHTISPQMQAAIDRGDFMLASGDETAAERHANVAAYKPLKSGDPAIDGEG